MFYEKDLIFSLILRLSDVRCVFNRFSPTWRGWWLEITPAALTLQSPSSLLPLSLSTRIPFVFSSLHTHDFPLLFFFLNISPSSSIPHTLPLSISLSQLRQSPIRFPFTSPLVPPTLSHVLEVFPSPVWLEWRDFH